MSKQVSYYRVAIDFYHECRHEPDNKIMWHDCFDSVIFTHTKSIWSNSFDLKQKINNYYYFNVQRVCSYLFLACQLYFKKTKFKSYCWQFFSFHTKTIGIFLQRKEKGMVASFSGHKLCFWSHTLRILKSNLLKNVLNNPLFNFSIRANVPFNLSNTTLGF